MQLQQNLTAPVFTTNDIYDRQINLSDYQDKKLLLGFFRHAGCPFCNLRVHTLTKIHQDLKAKGLEMIFFFESRAQVILRSTFHQGVSPIPIIADPEKKFYQLYGIERAPLKSSVSHLTSFVQTAYQAGKRGIPMGAPERVESLFTMPAEFLIDKGLVLRNVHYSDSLTDRMDVSVIQDFASGR